MSNEFDLMLNLIQISDLLMKVKIGFKMAAGKINGTNETTLHATSKKTTFDIRLICICNTFVIDLVLFVNPKLNFVTNVSIKVKT